LVRKTHPYKRGYAFERRVRLRLEKEGWFVVRQGKSAFPDLVCLKKGAIMFVECKVDGYLNPSDRKRLAEISTEVGAEAVLASRAGGRIIFKKVKES
jgi:Holliday junction resolvase